MVKGPCHFYASRCQRPERKLALHRLRHCPRRVTVSVVSAYHIRDYQRICFMAQNSSTCVLEVFLKRAEWRGGGAEGEYKSRINLTYYNLGIKLLRVSSNKAFYYQLAGLQSN